MVAQSLHKLTCKHAILPNAAGFSLSSNATKLSCSRRAFARSSFTACSRSHQESVKACSSCPKKCLTRFCRAARTAARRRCIQLQPLFTVLPGPAYLGPSIQACLWFPVPPSPLAFTLHPFPPGRATPFLLLALRHDALLRCRIRACAGHHGSRPRPSHGTHEQTGVPRHEC